MSQKPGKKIAPIPMSNNVSVVDLIDTCVLFSINFIDK